MKTIWMKFLYLFLLCPVLSSCNNEDENVEQSYLEGLTSVLNYYVGFTNNTGENLLENIPKVTKYNCTSYGFDKVYAWSGSIFGDGASGVAFDSWETYCDGELVISTNDDKSVGVSILNYSSNPPVLLMQGIPCVVVCGNNYAEWHLRKKGDMYLYEGSHVIEHHIVSQGIFGDDKTHVLRMEIKWHSKQNFKVQVQIDGVDVQMYYHPASELEPVMENYEFGGGGIENSAFLINVDKL